MDKMQTRYKCKYQDITIELKNSVARTYLYVNGVERDYWNISIKGGVLQCKLNEEINIKVIIEFKLLRATATVYVNDTQIDYIKSL